MLQAIRDRTTGWIVWFIVGLIIIPFAFFGIEQFRTGGGDPTVLKVGSQEITQSQLRAAYDNRYQQLQQMLGENFRADLFDQTRFRQAVLDDMAQESLLRQYATESGYRAGDAALFAYLSTIPAFQRDGKFDTEAYKGALARQGMDLQRFELQLRNSIEIDQMREAVVETAFVTEAAAREAYRLGEQQRWLTYVVVEPGTYLTQVQVSDDEVKARYEQNLSQFMAPERINLAYVELSQSALAKAEPPAEDTLKVLYDAEKDGRYTTPEERKARHILINFGSDKAEARKRIDALAAQLKAGKDFAELASASSDDPGSKAQGGDLGWVKRGQMLEKFEQALYALKPGEISEPVETEFGWHLIRLDELKAAQVRPFSDEGVRRELTELYVNRELQKRFQEQTEKLEQMAFENPSSLDAVAAELGVQIQTTGWFTRAGGAGLAAIDAVKQAAFSQEVLSDGENSKPLALGEGRVVVVRKSEYEPPRQKPLEEVAETLRSDLRSEAARARAQAEAADMLKAAQAGTPLAELAAARALELKSQGLVRRDTGGIEPQVLRELFRLPRPGEDGKAIYAEAALVNGAVAVLALSGVQEADWNAADEEARKRQIAQLRDAAAGAEFGGYRAAIEQAIRIKRYAAADEAAPVATPEE